MNVCRQSKWLLSSRLWVLAALWMVSSMGSIASAGSAQGRVMLADAIALGVVESGVVAKVWVQRGQRVKKGERLLALDPRDFKAHLSVAKARLAGLSLELAEAKREWERSQELYERKVLSDHDLELARIEYRKLEEDSNAATGEIRLRKIALERSELLAPFDALVVSIDSYEGQPVRNNLAIQPLLRMVPLDRVRIGFKLPKDEFLPLGHGVQVGYTGQSYNGFVDRLPQSKGGAAGLWVVEISASLPDLSHLGSMVEIRWK